MWERVRHMLRKEFIQVFADPRMKGIIFVMPIVQLLILSHAVNTDVRDIALGVWDADQTAESRALVSRFTGSGYFVASAQVGSDREAEALMDSADVQAVLHVKKGYGADLGAGKTAVVQFILDGSDSNTASVVSQYATRIFTGANKAEMVRRVVRGAGRAPSAGVETRSRAWFNANLESRFFFVPGIVALLITLTALTLTTMAVVREKEAGTMEQLMVTPITPWEFILGKTIPFAIIAFADVVLVAVVGVFWFQIPVRGSLVLLFGATAVYLLVILGLGLLISTVSRTQQQAMMSNFFFFLPCVLLSGFMFPIANMPEAVQVLTYLNPMRYYLVVVRGIFLKGVGMDVLWPQVAALAVLGPATFLVAVRRLRKTTL